MKAQHSAGRKLVSLVKHHFGFLEKKKPSLATATAKATTTAIKIIYNLDHWKQNEKVNGPLNIYTLS